MNRTIVLLTLLIPLSICQAQIQILSEVKPLPYANSSYNEVSVSVNQTAQEIYFTRINAVDKQRGRLDISDIWKLNTVSDTISSKTDALNSNYDDDILGFFDHDKKLLLRRNKTLYYSRRKQETWTEPVPLNIKFFKSNEKHISGSISFDQRYLVLALESYNSYGVEDIYMAERIGENEWSALKNLGLSINTSAQEISPFLSSDNNTLYFSSNGRADTEGSYDIYYSKRIGEGITDWSSPEPLTALNTKGSDYGFTYGYGDSTAYFISTMDSDGYGDIKQVAISPDIPKTEDKIKFESDLISTVDTLQSPYIETQDSLIASENLLIKASGFVLDQSDNSPILGEVLIQVDSVVRSIKTFANGEFEVKVRPLEIYPIRVDANGYLSKDTVFSIKGDETSYFTIKLNPIVDGKKVVLDHVLFERGTSKMLPGYESQLGLVISMLKKNPLASIFLEGHTDNRGNPTLNLKLSNDRVETVKAYIISSGIDASRVSGKGYGGSKPIHSNANEHSRLKNRRVEFLIRTKSTP